MVTELRAGMLVGRYRLRERIAQGGMGSVWSARDERLERSIAIKMLPRLLVSDPSAERRFEREARAMGRLQHPNVVSIFDVGTADPGTGEELPFLVMELISGRSLDQILVDGPISSMRAVRLLEQVGRALAAAHRAGVIHRDLKPSNVMISEDDHVKVLDFGLARISHRDGQTPEDTLTTPGMVLGSCPYMAPEQALGQEVSPASDIFSCGAVLYEALAGRRAFDGSTPMKVLQSVVRCDYPALAEIAPEVPPEVIEVVERCLQREPEKRFESGSEMAWRLAQIASRGEQRLAEAPTLEMSADLGEPPGASARIPRWSVAVAVVLALVAGAALGFFSGRSGTHGRRPQPGQWMFRQVAEVHGALRHPDWSPSGSELVFDLRQGDRSVIGVVHAGGGETRILARAHDSETLGLPRYSPDGKALAVGVAGEERTSVRIFPAVGGEPYAEIENAVNASWLDADRLVFSRRNEGVAELWTYRVESGEQAVLRSAEGERMWWGAEPRPGGGFVARGGPTERRSGLFFMASSEQDSVEWLAAGGEIFGQSWSPGGRSLVASVDGELMRVDDSGAERLLPAMEKLWDPRLSPDGTKLAVVRQQMTNDVVLVDPDGGGWSCLVCGVPDTGFGSVAGDGTAIYRRLFDGTARLVMREPDSGERILSGPDESASCPSFSPDGQSIAYLVNRPDAGVELRVVARSGGEPVILASGIEASEYPSWSPDGRFIAYAGGSPVRVWVVPVVGGAPRPLSPEGGDYPVWSPDGQRLAYVVWTDADDPQQGAWVIGVQGGAPRKVSPLPTRVFWNQSGDRIRQLRRSPDGIELWEAATGEWRWTLRSQLEIGTATTAHLEFLPLTSDPASDRLVMNRRTSISGLVVFDGVDPDRW